MTPERIKIEYDPTILEGQRCVVRIELNEQIYEMDVDEWQQLQSEGKTEAVTIGDRLKFVTPEDLEILKTVVDWIKNNKDYEL